MKQLTQKEREFCRLYVHGAPKYMGNATRCYQKVYGCGAQKQSSIWNYASRMTKKPHIQATIQEMAEKVDEDLISLQIAHIAKTAEKASDRLRALELLMQIKGRHFQEKDASQNDFSTCLQLAGENF